MLHAECAHWSSQVTAGPPSFPFAAKSWHTYVPPFDPLFPQHPSLNTVFCTARRPPSPSIPLPTHPTHSLLSHSRSTICPPAKRKLAKKEGRLMEKRGKTSSAFVLLPRYSTLPPPSPSPPLVRPPSIPTCRLLAFGLRTSPKAA